MQVWILGSWSLHVSATSASRRGAPDRHGGSDSTESSQNQFRLMACQLAALEIKCHNHAVKVRCGETAGPSRPRLPFEQECARRLYLIFERCKCDDTVEARFLQIQNLMEVWAWEDLHWLLDQKRFASAPSASSLGHIEFLKPGSSV